MKFNNLLSVFTPKDAKFIPLLNETSDIMLQAANLLEELFTLAEIGQRNEFCRLIKVEEVKGDKVTSRILKALNETFITPFDREDISQLADEMDDVIDAINRTAQKVLLYSPNKLPESTRQLTDVIRKGALEVQCAVKELDNLKKNDQKFRSHYKTIKHLEEQGDTLYENAIIKLFQEEKDTVELIKLKEIIQELEKTINKINNTGKVMKTIFVKYA